MTNVKDFVVTSQVKNIIIFDSVNKQFKTWYELKFSFMQMSCCDAISP